MTDKEFTDIMHEIGFKVGDKSQEWRYKKNENFTAYYDFRQDKFELYLLFTEKKWDNIIEDLCYTLENISKMNSVEFKTQIEGLVEYSYSLYMDINRHIGSIERKVETKLKRLGIKNVKEIGF